MHYTYEVHGQAYHIRLERLPDGRYEATIGTTRLVFAALASAEGWLLRFPDGRQVRGASLARADERFVQVDGQHYTLHLPKAGRRRKQGSGHHDLSAQMPGLITAVRVQEGQRVAAGEALVVMEAMKMEIRINAPSDGLVSRILVQVGQVVEQGAALVELESEESA